MSKKKMNTRGGMPGGANPMAMLQKMQQDRNCIPSNLNLHQSFYNNCFHRQQ